MDGNRPHIFWEAAFFVHTWLPEFWGRGICLLDKENKRRKSVGENCPTEFVARFDRVGRGEDRCTGVQGADHILGWFNRNVTGLLEKYGILWLRRNWMISKFESKLNLLRKPLPQTNSSMNSLTRLPGLLFEFRRVSLNLPLRLSYTVNVIIPALARDTVCCSSRLAIFRCRFGHFNLYDHDSVTEIGIKRIEPSQNHVRCHNASPAQLRNRAILQRTNTPWLREESNGRLLPFYRTRRYNRYGTFFDPRRLIFLKILLHKWEFQHRMYS